MYYICMYNMHYIHNKMTLFSKWREREREWENERMIDTDIDACIYIERDMQIQR